MKINIIRLFLSISIVIVFLSCSDQGNFIEIKDTPELVAAMNNKNEDPKNFEYDADDPEDGPYLTSMLPHFVWEDVKGEESYELIIKDIGRGDLYIIKLDADETEYTLDKDYELELSFDDDDDEVYPYEWHVRAKNSFQYMPSDKAQFYIISDAIPPTDLKGPEDGCIGDNFVFEWKSTATLKYEVEYSSDNFTLDINNASKKSKSSSEAEINKTGTYKWRVRSVSIINKKSEWVEYEGTFEVKESIPPANLTSPTDVCDSENLTFSWTNADEHTYTIETTPTTNENWSVLKSGIADSTFSSTIAAGFTYNWRIKSNGPCGESEWVNGTAFSVIAIPTLTDIGSNTDGKPVFQWTSGGTDITYDLYVSTDANAGTTPYQSDVTNTSYTPFSALADGTYYWKVVAKKNGTTCESTIGTFTVNTCVTPDIPTASEPFNDAVYIHENRTFEWSMVTNADKYILEIATDAGFTSYIMGSPITIHSNTTTTWTPPSHYSNSPGSVLSGDMYWRIKAQTNCGGESTYSSANHFHVKTYSCSNTTKSSAIPDGCNVSSGVGVDTTNRKVYITNHPYAQAVTGYNFQPNQHAYFYKYNMDGTISYEARYGGGGSANSFLNYNKWGGNACGGEALGLVPYNCVCSYAGACIGNTSPSFMPTFTDIMVFNNKIYASFSVLDAFDGHFVDILTDCFNYTCAEGELYHQKIVRYSTDGNWEANLAFGGGGKDVYQLNCGAAQVGGPFNSPHWNDNQALITGITASGSNIYGAQIDLSQTHIMDTNPCAGSEKRIVYPKKIPITGGAFSTTDYPLPGGSVWKGSGLGVAVDETNNLLFIGVRWIESLQFFVEVYNVNTGADLGTATLNGYTYGGSAGVDIIQTNAGNYLVTTDTWNKKLIIWKYNPSSPSNATLLPPVIGTGCSGFSPWHIEADDAASLSTADKYDLYVANEDCCVYRFNSTP